MASIRNRSGGEPTVGNLPAENPVTKKETAKRRN